MESSNVEDPNAEGEVMQQISNSVPPEELSQVGDELEKEETYDDEHVDDQMDTDKESSTEEKTPLNDELQHGYRILCELMSDTNKAVNWPFLNPVDDSLPELEDYYERIPRPMWMKKMRISFEKREYQSINDFVADFRLMFENCYRYNGPDSYISKRGQRLETMLGQKLALLPRNLREKTIVTATTDSSSSSEEIAVAAGLRRRTRAVGTPDSSALLNQLRQEEVIREKKARKQHMEDRKAAQEAHVQEVIGWEDVLLIEPLNTQMKAMWELPQIGHFLFLCQEPLYLAEVPQYELERCFLMSRESTTMQRIMSSLLSTPHQRTKLFNHRHRMPYKVWEEKLQAKVKNWYDVLESFGGDVNKTADKLGLDPFAFQILGMKNPLKGKKYHELGFYRKVWIMKCVCDHVLDLQESLREAIELQPPEEQREYVLGNDAEGNVYIHFPQFCGADLRVYRHKPFPDPFMENRDSDSDSDEEPLVKPKMETVQNFTPVKKKYSSSKSQVTSEIISPPSVRPSRLRQKIKTILPPTTVTTSGEDDDYEESNDTDYIEPTQKVKKKRGRKKKYYSQSNTFESWEALAERRAKKNGNFRRPTYLTQSKFLKILKKRDSKKALECNNSNDNSTSKLQNPPACKLHPKLKDSEVESGKPAKMSRSDSRNELCKKKNNNVLIDNKLSNGIKQEIPSESSDSNEGKNGVTCTCTESKDDIDIKTEGSLKNEPTDELLETKPDKSKMNEKELKSLSSPAKDSKGCIKDLKTKTSSDDLKSDSVEQNETDEKSLAANSNDVSMCKEEKEEADVEMLPEIGNFELIVDSVQELRELVEKFENESGPPVSSKGRKPKTKHPPRKKCVTELLARLSYLLNELEPWEAKLIQANQKARRKMKREQETYKEETPRKELRTRSNQANLNRNADSGQKSDQGIGRRSARNSPKTRSTPDKSKSTLTPVTSTTPCEDEFPDLSSRGRLRKRRIIPNNVENELNAKKRKSPRVEESVVTPVNKRAALSRSKKNSVEKNQQGTSSANGTPLSTCSAEAKSANIKQSSYPVIHQLLSNGQGALDAAAQTEIKFITSKGVLHSQNIIANQTVLTTTANILNQSKPTNVATTINLSTKLLTPQAVTAQTGAGGKIQYYTQLSNLSPQLIQQLLRNATVTKSTSSAEGDVDNKGRRTIVLSSTAINRPNNLISPTSVSDQEDKSKKSTILISSIPNPSAAFTTPSTVITPAGTNTGNKPVFQNSNIHTVLPQQFQVLLRTSDPSALVAASAPKICKNQTKAPVKPQQGPVYVISKQGVTSQILGAGTKLTTGLPIKTGQSPQTVVQNAPGVIIPSTASPSFVNVTVPSSVSLGQVDSLDNQSVEALMQSQGIDPQLILKNNLAKPPGKYACNVTVKSLLENRVTKKTVDDGSENVQITNGLSVPVNQPVSAGNTSAVINNAVMEVHPTLSSSVNDSAHVAKNTCLLSAVQSQFLDVKTDPQAAAAANLKIASPLMLPSVQPGKCITQTIQSTRTPLTVTPNLMPAVESTKGNLLASNQANIIQSLQQSGSNMRVNIPQPTLLTQPALMSLKQPAGRSVAFLQSGTSIPGSKNVILKVVPQNMMTATTMGSEPSSNIVINVPKGGGQVNIPPTRKISQNELKQLGSLPQHILTAVNQSGAKTQATTVQSVLSSKSLSTPPLGLQIATSGIPLTMQKSNNQNILLLSPKDQNLQQQQQQQQQKKPIGVIPIQDQYNSKDLLKKVSTVQQIQGLSGQTLQIIPSQGTSAGLNNITTIQGQLLQSKNGNIILTHSTAPVPSTGNFTQLLHSSLNNHLTVTNAQCSINTASPATIQTCNVTTPSNISMKGKEHLKTFKTILTNTGASIKLKNDNTAPSPSNPQINSNNLSGVRVDASSCSNLITTGLSDLSAVSLSTIDTKHLTPSVPSSSTISMVSPLMQPKLISSVISPQIATNTTQYITQYPALATSNKARTVSLQPPVSALLPRLDETPVGMAPTVISTTPTLPVQQPTQLHQNVSFLSGSSHQTSSITPQHMISPGTISNNSILVATSASSSKDTDGILKLKSTSSQPVSAVTDVSKIKTKLSPQNIQTNLSHVKVLGQAVQSSVKNKHSLLQQKLSPPPNVQHTKLQTLVPQNPATVSQTQPTILSNNVLNIGQTNPSNVVPQLVLYSIGGQLVTPQGIPVTLENGVLKILTPSPPVATQNQVMLVQSPNPSLVGSSQIQTLSTPYSDLLKTIKPSSSAGTILLSDSSLSTTAASAQSAIDVPSQMTYAVPAQGILTPSGAELHQQYSPKVVTNFENHVLASSTQEPISESVVVSMAQTQKVAATNVHNKAFLFTSPTVANKDIGTAKQQQVTTSNLNDLYLKKQQSILSSNTMSGTTMVLMDANNLQAKHSIFYPVSMAGTQAIAKPVGENVVNTHTVDKSQPGAPPVHQAKEKEDSFESAAILLSLAQQPTASSGGQADIDPSSVVSYGELESMNHQTQPE